MSKPSKTQVPSQLPLVEDEDTFIQNVWQTTYSSCLGAILASKVIMPHDDKFLIRDIHKALYLADTAKEAAKSYIENRKKEIAKLEAQVAGDPLSKLMDAP